MHHFKSLFQRNLSKKIIHHVIYLLILMFCSKKRFSFFVKEPFYENTTSHHIWKRFILKRPNIGNIKKEGSGAHPIKRAFCQAPVMSIRVCLYLSRRFSLSQQQQQQNLLLLRRVQLLFHFPGRAFSLLRSAAAPSVLVFAAAESEAQSRITRQPAILWGICFDVFFCLADLLLLRNTVDVAQWVVPGGAAAAGFQLPCIGSIDKSLGVDDCVAKRMMNFHRKCFLSLSVSTIVRSRGLGPRPFFCTLAPLGSEFQVIFIISAVQRADMNVRVHAHFNLRKIAFCWATDWGGDSAPVAQACKLSHMMIVYKMSIASLSGTFSGCSAIIYFLDTNSYVTENVNFVSYKYQLKKLKH